MPVDAPNPYQPPSVQDSGLPTNAVSRTKTLLIPPILTIVSTLLLWVGFATLLGPATNHRTVIFFWSATLLISLTVSAYCVNRIWSHQVSAISMGVGFVLFGIVFCLLEGDTSNGTDLVQASVVYGTLTASPLITFALTSKLNRTRVDRSTQGNG